MLCEVSIPRRNQKKKKKENVIAPIWKSGIAWKRKSQTVEYKIMQYDMILLSLYLSISLSIFNRYSSGGVSY